MKKIFFIMLTLTFVAIIFTLGHILGFGVGKLEGIKEEREMIKKIQCEIDYGSTEQQGIPGECLKYFLE